MKRILFILTLAAMVLTGCNKDKVNFQAKDLLGVWVHVETIYPNGTKAENDPLVLEFTKNHEVITYSSGSYSSFDYGLKEDQLIQMDSNVSATILTLDGTHLVYRTDDGAQITWINIEKILPGEWTAQWQAKVHYVTISADGRSSWINAQSGQSAGTYSWEIHVDIEKSRAVIFYTGENWSDTESVDKASDNEILVTNSAGGPGKYTRGKIANVGPLGV